MLTVNDLVVAVGWEPIVACEFSKIEPVVDDDTVVGVRFCSGSARKIDVVVRPLDDGLWRVSRMTTLAGPVGEVTVSGGDLAHAVFSASVHGKFEV